MGEIWARYRHLPQRVRAHPLERLVPLHVHFYGTVRRAAALLDEVALVGRRHQVTLGLAVIEREHVTAAHRLALARLLRPVLVRVRVRVRVGAGAGARVGARIRVRARVWVNV